MAKLSPTMRKALDLARQGGGRLVRLGGGFWVPPGAPIDRFGWPERDENGHRRYVVAGTIDALIVRGVLEVEMRAPWGGPSAVRVAADAGE